MPDREQELLDKIAVMGQAQIELQKKNEHNDSHIQHLTNRLNAAYTTLNGVYKQLAASRRECNRYKKKLLQYVLKAK